MLSCFQRTNDRCKPYLRVRFFFCRRWTDASDYFAFFFDNGGMAKRKKKSSVLLTVITWVLVAVIAVCAVILCRSFMGSRESKSETAHIESVINENAYNTGGYSDVDWQAVCKQLKAENPDFVAYLQFDSGIISQPVVQGETNDTYLRTSFYKKPSETGAVFLDSNMFLDDTNFVIYGHNVYYDHASFFAPLTTFEDQSVYDQNSTLKLYTDTFVRSYVITDVYEVTRSEYETEEYQSKYTYQKRIFSDEADYNDWVNYACAKNTITPSDTLSYGDNTMTLQVCKPYHHDTRIIVVCKETSEYFWGNQSDQNTPDAGTSNASCDVNEGC